MEVNDLVSVIILTHNKLEYTRICLPSLLATDYAPWELIVVDNGSTDGTQEWLHSFSKTTAEKGVSLRVIMNDHNIGCSTARNMGAQAANGSKLVFLDNDVALRSSRWIKIFIERLGSDPKNVVIGPKLVYPFEPYDIQCAGVGISRTGRVQFRGRGFPRDDRHFDFATEVQCLISACIMLKRTPFEEAGGFDEAFNPVEYEDFDLCYKMRKKGGKALYEHSVEMYHFESVTTDGTPSLPNRYLIIKHGLLFKKRWRHIFEKENGPSDSETKWAQIPVRGIEELKGLPLID